MRLVGAGLATLAWLASVPASAEGGPSPEPVPPVHLDLAAPGPSLASRLDEIQQRVQAVAVYPPIARTRSVEGETLVSFVVGAGGTAEEVRTERSSGSLALDRAAERAVLDADRLPYVFGRVRVPVVFQLRDAPASDPH